MQIEFYLFTLYAQYVIPAAPYAAAAALAYYALRHRRRRPADHRDQTAATPVFDRFMLFCGGGLLLVGAPMVIYAGWYVFYFVEAARAIRSAVSEPAVGGPMAAEVNLNLFLAAGFAVLTFFAAACVIGGGWLIRRQYLRRTAR